MRNTNGNIENSTINNGNWRNSRRSHKDLSTNCWKPLINLGTHSNRTTGVKFTKRTGDIL